MDKEEEEEEDEIVLSSGRRLAESETVREETMILDTLTEAMAYKAATSESTLKTCMKALCLMHNLEEETCMKVVNDDEMGDTLTSNQFGYTSIGKLEQL